MKIHLKFEDLSHNLINLPFFVFRKKNIKNLSILGKIYFLFSSYFITLCFKIFEQKIFCSLMNFFYGKDGKVSYSKSKKLYTKEYKNNLIYYPNKYRLSGSMVNHRYELQNLLNSYCLDNFEINAGDTILDCGANVGLLNLAINEFEKEINYIGFEPDNNVFRCLELNTKNNHKTKIYNIGLSDSNSTENTLYLDSDHGDSSLEPFDAKSKLKIEARKLDEFKLKKIKLFKIDAEGHELKVLLGSEETLKEIAYIAIDMGEGNEGKKTTVPSVVNYLIKNNFELLDFNKERITGLFKNKSM